MKISSGKKGFTRRTFVKGMAGGVLLSYLNPLSRFASAAEPDPVSKLFWVKDIPNQPFLSGGAGNYHAGMELLLNLMGENGLKFYRSSQETTLSGPDGMIQSNDVVLIKVNAQWKYRGCTNSDLIRGLIQRILEGHPDGFNGEVVIFENGQGRGSLNCDTTGGDYPDGNVHANANNESHSFLYLANTIFSDSRVSCFLLDPIRSRFISASDHVTNGYRLYEDVSYPCFTTTGKGYRIELREGIWQGGGYNQNLKLINVPVLKHHDTGGSEITASLKHFYGVLSMADGQSDYRHYSGLGNTCGKMMVSVRTPVLNIIDAIWVSYSSLSGYPASTTFRTNQILASQDPVALDYWGAKYILYPVNNNPRHHPDFAGVNQWLTDAEQIINVRGGLYDPEKGIVVDMVTKSETKMMTITGKVEPQNPVILISPNGGETVNAGTVLPITWMNQSQVATVDIFYSLTGTDPWDVIASNVTALPCSFNWSVPTTLTATYPNCKIMIKAFDASGIQLGVDTSDGYFTIRGESTTPSITIIFPNGGEIWRVKTSQTIKWKYTRDPGNYVKIELLKGGSVIRILAPKVRIGSNGSGSYKWKISSTQTPGNDYTIRVSSTTNSLYSDTSNNNFTIT